MNKKHICYKFAINSIANEDYPKYVKIQCQNFLNDLEQQENEDFKYFLDVKLANKITKLTKLINFASGANTGKSCYDGLAGFQWFLIINTLCWKHKDNKDKRRYEKAVLLIARKNGKSFLVALIFILLLLIEPKFSEFYSVAPDRELSRIVKKEAEQLLRVSPALINHFKLRRTDVECLITNSKFVPLALSENRMDGRKANVYVADEVGALPNRGAIDAMASSQMNMVNRLGILISTAYSTEINVMTEEIEYCKKVLDGYIEDETCFSLLFAPDITDEWMTDVALKQANPLALEIEGNFKFLLEQRQKAIEMPSTLTNFKTKHLNIFVNGNVSETYIELDDFKLCKTEKIDWEGREVFIGLDLSQSTDNTAVAMMSYDMDTGEFLAKVWAFIPAGNVENKIAIEKIDYRSFIRQGDCFACGTDNVIDYGFVEKFILDIENKYDVTINSIGYDRYNCISSAQKLEDAGYSTIEVKQHSSVLHPATKLLREKVLSQDFKYTKNQLLEINIANCKELKDTNLNSYISKKKSTGKVDMVVSLINAMAILNQNMLQRNAYEDREEGFLVL